MAQENAFNPFAALVEEPQQVNGICEPEASPEEIEMNNLIAAVFSITIDSNGGSKNNRLIYLQDLADIYKPRTTLDFELLEQALFERLLLEDPEQYVVPTTRQPDPSLCEQQIVIYLFHAYLKLHKASNDQSIVEPIRCLIMNNIITALKQPDLFNNQCLNEQFVVLTQSDTDFCNNFIYDMLNHALLDDDGLETIQPYVYDILRALAYDISGCTIELILPSVINTLQMFTQNVHLANLLLDFCTLNDTTNGSLYAKTVLGQLLNLSILKKSPNGAPLYFTDPIYHRNSNLEGNLWTAMSNVVTILHDVFLNLLKCSPEVKNKTLSWIGKCLQTNGARGKIWNAQTTQDGGNCVSDAFMVNLAMVLLTLCQPFCNLTTDSKLLKVDPTYCAVPLAQTERLEVHLSMAEETCLVPNETDAPRPIAAKYSFITECFYFAHKAIDLGIRVAVEKVIKLNQEMGRIQRTYNEVMSEMGAASNVMDSLKQRLETEMTQFLCFKATLLQPKLVDSLMLFLNSTAHWLTQVCVRLDFPPDPVHYYPATRTEITFPLSDIIPDTLKCIPESITENIVCYLTFIRRFNPITFEEQNYTSLSPLLTFLLMFMGSPQRIRNPHLRARMAEALEALLPYHSDDPPGISGSIGFQREKLFVEHPHRSEIVSNLLEVFVGIEMTGESVQFEQKFHYRRPMYLVMNYLLGMDEHCEYFERLAEDANVNMEAVKPPLFLRFINLLINDAIFLLDEALSNMSQLREMQTARDNGEWESLNVMERAQNYSSIQHTGMLARFDNILSKDTIGILVQLTSRITIVFTHPTLVDRVAAMLNYFLFNLVGPKKKNFKVKDQKEYEFDPAGTVLDICKVYVNLKENEAFCLAVSQDGRSYKPELFTLAEDVLVRIGGGILVGELQQVAVKVAEQAAKQQAEQEALSDAPDEFLDPIMSTLMLDPVILPSSKQIVDRTTIARHLLSDQSDPFNRSPLTMDQIIPATEFAQRIKDWLRNKTK